MGAIKKSAFLPLLLFIPLFFIVLLLTGCAANSLVLETKVNDPIMMNLLDMNADLSQIEDGTGVIGEATACPT
ncbi:MAG TPA: hypothetical protein VGB38_08545 [bacterium]